MENKKYVVCRDDIYVGEVVRTDRIHRYEGDNVFLRIKPGQLDVEAWKSYRSILFVPNEKKFSNDLLYRTPNYPIINVTDDETCLNLGENSIVIKDACNLAILLEYFGYKKDLTFEDIMEIRSKIFFTNRFAKDNCRLFGWEEFITEAGNRMFYSVSESLLPKEYWNVLDDRGDNTLADAIRWGKKMNAFTPHCQEGAVKRLKRF